MTSDGVRWHKTETIFHEALPLGEPERTAVLTARCCGDGTLMAELRELLEACEEEEAFCAETAASPPVETGRRLGPYAIDRLLGRGGMGAVYLAHRADGQFEQQIAIKIIDMPLATDLFRDRFRTERQILAGLNHPYIARLLDGGVSEGELYLAMEYIDGVPITRFCKEHGLSIEARLELFAKVCEAVQFAHQSLVVHRDLKPDNILVSPDGKPHLLDFGTAKILLPVEDGDAANMTRQGMQTFTPRFASPEQVLGRPITVASDTYSLGVLLYLLLTDGPPYELPSLTTEEMVRVICEETPRRPGAAAAPFGKIDADLDSIVLKALRKEPEQRYATAADLAADVERYLEHRPVMARRGNVRYRASKFVRRHGVGLAASVLVVLSLAAGAGGIVEQTRRAQMERRRAEAREHDVRRLSNTLLAAIQDAFKGLPGSTEAQKLLVSRALEQLDQTSTDARGDRVLELDLVKAYTMLGNVQGNPSRQNLGDPAGALRSLDKALGFAAGIGASESRDRNELGLMRRRSNRGVRFCMRLAFDGIDGSIAARDSGVRRIECRRGRDAGGAG